MNVAWTGWVLLAGLFLGLTVFHRRWSARRHEAAGNQRAEKDRVLRLATAQYETIGDPAVHACWHVVIEALDRGWLNVSSLDRLIESLERGGGGAGAEEYSIDVDHEGGDTSFLVVSFVGDRFRCPRENMLVELRRLADRIADGAS